MVAGYAVPLFTCEAPSAELAGRGLFGGADDAFGLYVRVYGSGEA